MNTRLPASIPLVGTLSGQSLHKLNSQFPISPFQAFASPTCHISTSACCPSQERIFLMITPHRLVVGVRYHSKQASSLVRLVESCGSCPSELLGSIRTEFARRRGSASLPWFETLALCLALVEGRPSSLH